MRKSKEAYSPTPEEMEAYKAKSTGLKDWQIRSAIRKEYLDRKMCQEIPYAEYGSYAEPDSEPGDEINQAINDLMAQAIDEEDERLAKKFGKKNF